MLYFFLKKCLEPDPKSTNNDNDMKHEETARYDKTVSDLPHSLCSSSEKLLFTDMSCVSC